MTVLPRRARVARIAVGLVALGAPLLAASSAQGALGTGHTLLASQRPSLVSVTNSPPGTALVNFCFGTPTVGGTPLAIAPPNPPGTYNPSNFFIGGYHFSNLQPALSVTQINNQCIQGTFGGEVPKYSYGFVNFNAAIVTIGGSPFANQADSSALVNSDGHNGTRGLSFGLDLQNVLFPGGNRIAFAFDQDIDSSISTPAGCPDAVPPLGCTVNGLFFYDQSGIRHGVANAHLISISGNLAVVEYTAPDAVNDATIALAERGATMDDGGGPVPFLADTPGSVFGFAVTSRLSVGTGLAGSGQTSDVYLDSAALVNNGDSAQINYTFKSGGANANIAVGPGGAPCFHATMSDGQGELHGDAVVTSGNVATVTFNGAQNVSEMIVGASVREAGDVGCAGNAVQSTSGGVPNDAGGKPVGGNAGAFQTGYTTGPEGNGLTISGSDATVAVDQRVDPATISLAARLVNAQGAIYGPVPSNAAVLGNGSPNGSHSVVYTFDPTALQSAAGIFLPGFGEIRTFNVTGEFAPQLNPPQILAKN